MQSFFFSFLQILNIDFVQSYRATDTVALVCLIFYLLDMYGVKTVFTQSISRTPGYLYFSIRKITSRSGFFILNQIQLKQTHLQNLTLFINLLLVFFFRISVCLWISFDTSQNARPWSSWQVHLPHPLNRVIHHCGRTDTFTMADKHSRRLFRHNKVYYFSCYNTTIL